MGSGLLGWPTECKRDQALTGKIFGQTPDVCEQNNDFLNYRTSHINILYDLEPSLELL